MNRYNFIFSNNWRYRISRHFVFWLAVFIYHFVRGSFLFPSINSWKILSAVLINSLTWGVMTNMIICYTVTYYLIPKFFDKKKYIVFAVGLLVLLIVAFGIVIFNTMVLNPVFTQAIGKTQQQPYIHLRGSVIRFFGNPPLICALFLSLRTFKKWHLKQKENEILLRENANAELQLLKAQVHPHFLFNTLNNIYSFTLSKSPEASSLISKLSDTLQYMISDCKTDLVPLEKELKMLEDYIGLEKVRYGDRLEMWTDVRGDYKNKLIAPLIMIPFVENCFKHGSSAMRGKQWIQLSIHIKETMLHFQLKNSKPPEPVQIKNKSGIGLINVKKRLALLYPDHQLDISSAEGVFSVSLQLELQTATPDKKELISKYSVLPV